jgi:hypothetical protein
MRRAATTVRLAMPLNAHALVIQIVGYPQMPLPDVRDADDLADVLRDPELCHYPLRQVTVLHEAQATRAGVLAALRALVAAADEDAAVLLYFSGYGGQRGETMYLLPYDCDPEALARTAISARALREELAPLRAGKVLLIFDCCHAGGSEGQASRDDDGGSGRDVVLPGLTEAVADELVSGRGWALIASSQGGQRSFVQRDARNSIFTHLLLDGLRGGRASDDGYVRVFDLFEYLQPRVVREEPRQRPMFKCALSENFAIARHRGGAVGAVPRTDDGFLYHALICYAEADAARVREALLLPLSAAGLRMATTQGVVEPGLERVIGLERGLTQARRTLVVVSQAFLRPNQEVDCFADFAALQRKDAYICKGLCSLIPIYLDDRYLLREVPTWLASLSGVQLGDAAGSHIDVDDEMARLIHMLRRPLLRR